MSKKAQKEDLEVRMADYLDNLRLTDAVDYDTYSDLMDTMGDMIDEAYELGKK